MIRSLLHLSSKGERETCVRGQVAPHSGPLHPVPDGKSGDGTRWRVFFEGGDGGDDRGIDIGHVITARSNIKEIRHWFYGTLLPPGIGSSSQFPRIDHVVRPRFCGEDGGSLLIDAVLVEDGDVDLHTGLLLEERDVAVGYRMLRLCRSEVGSRQALQS